MKIEKQFEAYGLQCVIVTSEVGYRCGYVGVDFLHPLYNQSADEHNLEVHGGITYTDGGKYSAHPIESDLWWFGFDCAHYGDAKDETIEEYRNSRHYDDDQKNGRYLLSLQSGTVKTLEFCIEECTKLACQLHDLATKTYYI